MRPAAGDPPEGAAVSRRVGVTSWRDTWSDGFGHLAARSVQVVAVLVVVAITVFALRQLNLVLIPVVLALIIASAFNPAMTYLRRVMPSWLAAALVLLSVLGVLGGLAALVTLAVRNQWSELRESVDEGATKLRDFLTDLPFGIDRAQLDEWGDAIVDFATSQQAGSTALAGISTGARFLTGMLLMFVVLFFFLKDGPTMWEFLLRPFEGVAYERARRIGRHTVTTLGDYARGTAIVAAVDAVFIGAGLLILRVPLAIPLAVIVLVTAFIPVIGAVIAGFLAALVALVANGPVTALVVVGIVVLVNQVEGQFLQPVVMGRSLHLHALIVMLALTIGTVLGGIVGGIIAVPTVAVAWRIAKVWNGEDEPARPVREKPRAPA